MQFYTPQKTHDNWSEELQEGRKDMQGLLVRGYKSLNAARYLLLRITDSLKAKAYFNYLIQHHITNAEKPPEPDATYNEDPKEAIHLAFTHKGLKALGLPEEVLQTFSREFNEGMDFSYPDPDDKQKTIRERSTLLGDTKNNSPQYWHWGNDDNPVDCVLMLFAETDVTLEILVGKVYDKISQGVALAYLAKTNEYDSGISKEHFGFDDNISQPLIKGLRKAKRKEGANLVNPGEFILGYTNAYGSYSPSPYVDACSSGSNSLKGLPHHSDKKDLGKNGTYLVFRQMEQHVEKFCRFLHQHSREAGNTPIQKAMKLGAKMIGRWPDGLPLTTCPTGNCPVPPEELNDFGYAATDKFGIHCPLGAHIRRTNPRDQVHTREPGEDSLELAGKHRMLRRGRIYGEPYGHKFDLEIMIRKATGGQLQEAKPTGQECAADTIAAKEESYSRIPLVRGLHFICLVSDIARQFEFVQNVWANTSTFGDLCNEVDPVISPRPTADQPDCHEFTTPQSRLRNRYLNVPEFTTVVGGAYFFMPGIASLQYIMNQTDEEYLIRSTNQL